jgi:hypothetical protein
MRCLLSLLILLALLVPPAHAATPGVCPNGDAGYPWVYIGVAPDGTVLWDLDYSRPFCPDDAPPAPDPTPAPEPTYAHQLALPVVSR